MKYNEIYVALQRTITQLLLSLILNPNSIMISVLDEIFNELVLVRKFLTISFSEIKIEICKNVPKKLQNGLLHLNILNSATNLAKFFFLNFHYFKISRKEGEEEEKKEFL